MPRRARGNDPVLTLVWAADARIISVARCRWPRAHSRRSRGENPLPQGRLPGARRHSWCLVLFIAGSAMAETPQAVLVSDGSAGSGHFHVGLDYFENLTLAYEEDGEIVVQTRGSTFFEKVSLGEGVDPQLAFDPLGTHVAYAAPPASGGSRKIHLQSRTASLWSYP